MKTQIKSRKRKFYEEFNERQAIHIPFCGWTFSWTQWQIPKNSLALWMAQSMFVGFLLKKILLTANWLFIALAQFNNRPVTTTIGIPRDWFIRICGITA